MLPSCRKRTIPEALILQDFRDFEVKRKTTQIVKNLRDHVGQFPRKRTIEKRDLLL